MAWRAWLARARGARPRSWLWVVAILGLGLVALAVQALLGDAPTWWALRAYSGAPLLSPLVLLYILVLNGFGEEIGWRGFLFEHLERGHGLLTAALATGVIWALWHAPLFWCVANYGAMSPATVVGWLVGLLCGSVLLSWLYLEGGRSTLLVAVWHVAFDLTSATAGTQGLIAAVTSTAVMFAALAIVVMQRRRRPIAVAEPVRPHAG